MTKISVSMLASDYSKFGEEALRMQRAGVDFLHMDVMDGCFVPNISFGAGVIKAVHKVCDAPLDVHLMVNDPASQIKFFAEAGADLISFHLESRSDARKTLELIRSFGVKSALAVKPGTPIEEAFPLVELCDMVLVMTVEPGYGGQAFIPETLDKIRALRSFAGDSIDIEVDGGINGKTAPLVKEAGANVLVAGTGLFKAEDMAQVNSLLKAPQKGQA